MTWICVTVSYLIFINILWSCVVKLWIDKARIMSIFMCICFPYPCTSVCERVLWSYIVHCFLLHSHWGQHYIFWYGYISLYLKIHLFVSVVCPVFRNSCWRENVLHIFKLYLWSSHMQLQCCMINDCKRQGQPTVVLSSFCIPSHLFLILW